MEVLERHIVFSRREKMKMAVKKVVASLDAVAKTETAAKAEAVKTEVKKAVAPAKEAVKKAAAPAKEAVKKAAAPHSKRCDRRGSRLYLPQRNLYHRRFLSC